MGGCAYFTLAASVCVCCKVLSNDDLKDLPLAGLGNVADILRDADTNGDGEIDFEEFMALMRKS